MNNNELPKKRLLNFLKTTQKIMLMWSKGKLIEVGTMMHLIVRTNDQTTAKATYIQSYVILFYFLDQNILSFNNNKKM